MNYLRPERLDALAREYALGTLPARARRRFERVLRDQPAAVQVLAGWQRALDALAAMAPPMQPRALVWAGLEKRLFAPPAAPSKKLPWWQSLVAPRALARAGAGALFGVLLALVVVRHEPGWVGLETAQQTLPPSYVGLLSDSAGKPAVLLSSRRHGRVLTTKMLQPLALPPGRVAQLWALPRDGGAPFPVGIVPAQGSASIALADTSERLFFSVGRLAVSFEPAALGAGAGAKPSAEFILIGPCVKLW